MKTLLARGANEPETKPSIGFLWETPYKPCERHIRRQVSCSQLFEQIVLTRDVDHDPSQQPARVVRLERRKQVWTKLYRKYVLGTPRRVYNQDIDTLARFSRALNLRMLHVFFGTKAASNLMDLQLLDIPVTVSFHGRDVSECKNRDELSRHLPGLFELASAVFARSRYMAGRLESLGCPASKIWLNWSAIPLDEFPYRERARRAGDPMVFLQVSRLIEKKGLFDTLEAFDRVRRDVPGAQLRIAGEGPLEDALRAEIERRGMSRQVHMLGLLTSNEIVQELHGAHLFVHPSTTTRCGDQEGIPNSMLEAMATGLPAATTRHAGIPEAVTHGVTGWLSDEGRPDELAEHMLFCARNPEAVNEVGRAARRFVESRHSLSLRRGQLDEKYAEVMESNAPRAASLESVVSRMRELSPA